MENNRINGILSALKQDDCIIFIGSGISMWSELPSWNEMINELANYIEANGQDATLIRKEAFNGDLLQAASYGFGKLTNMQIGMFMKQACRYGKAEPQLIHEKIIKLGCKCYITTNYDKLIENSISKYLSQEPFMVVTNRQLSEMGNIMQARATNFIYKPHGDVEDVESIILTREQYRKLLPNGERHMALETLKSLMVSRPVVYIGFGLRDPDFLYIRNILSNIYQGNNIREHYAIMADIEKDEVDFWRENYGIHLIGYETGKLPNRLKSHQKLLNLISTITERLSEKDYANKEKPDSEIILALLRYVALLIRYPKADPEFRIYVHEDRKFKLENSNTFFAENYDGSLVEDFLTNYDGNSILIGLPGAGKSYSMRRAVAILAEQLQDKCLHDENLLIDDLMIPIYIDLKLYNGDIKNMIEDNFSKSLSFKQIIRKSKCKIFLDSFNEMPGEFWNNNSYQEDFRQAFEEFKNVNVIIGSRTKDGLDKFEFPVCYLDEIDKITIVTELRKRGKNEKLDREMYQILRKPFYFKYIINEKIDIDNIFQPKDFYKELFNVLLIDFKIRFSKRLDILSCLSNVAYRALGLGIEVFPIEFIYEEIKNQTTCLDSVEFEKEIANWLIFKTILIPHAGGKIAFVHQSVTEYLAASKLSELYIQNANVINDKFKYYRWDQAMFFMVNLLPKEMIESFIQKLFEIDFGLVLRTVKYVEFQQEQVVDRILKEIISNEDIRCSYEYDIERCLRYDLPITDRNEKNIRRIVYMGNNLGGAAVFSLKRLIGNGIKNELIQLIFEYASDYNFCRNSVAEALRPMIKEEDIGALVDMVDNLQVIYPESDESLEKLEGLITAISYVMNKFDVSILKKYFVRNYELSQLTLIRKEIICETLRDKHTSESLEFAGDLFMQGYQKASITIYFIAHFAKEKLCWNSFSKEHVDKLIDILNGDVWAIETLKELLSNRKDLCIYAEEKSELHTGITKAAILWCVIDENQDSVFKEIESMLYMKDNELRNQPYNLLGDMELNWRDRENLYINLIKIKNIELASALMGGAVPPDIEGIDILEIGNIYWWLEWIVELEESKDTEDKIEWFIFQLVSLIAEYADKKSKSQFVLEFNKQDCKYREIILKYILPKLHTNISDYNENSIEYILNDLRKTSYVGSWNHHFLAYASTEKFVIERLLPLLNTTNEKLKKNLVDIIKIAGSEHGKRYFLFIDENKK